MKPGQKRICPKAGFQTGLSLVELMVSITIGLIILASLTSMFVNQSKSRTELDKTNRMIDNGRYAMELLAANLRLAGYYDDFSPVGTPVNIYSPCDMTPVVDATKNLEILLLHIQGYDAADATSEAVAQPFTNPPYSGQLPCTLTYTAGSDKTLRAGSDILTLRRASTAVAPSGTGTTKYLQVSKCVHDAAQPPNNYQIAAGAAASFAAMRKKNCVQTADLRPFMALTYFVAPQHKPGDGIPTLKQIDQDGVVTPLVEGIEYMQIDYGVDGDVNGDGLFTLAQDDINGDGVLNREDLNGAPDSYSSTCTACASSADWAGYWSNVVSVRVNIVARNTEETIGWKDDKKTYSLGRAGTVGPFNDAYKRHAFTQVIRLVNPSGRRE